jgi:hypothetical protein
MDRRAQLGPELAALEIDDLGRLLGRAPASVADGLATLDGRIAAWHDDPPGPGTAGRLTEETVLGYLWRRAWRNEELYEPLLRFLPARRFGPIDVT